MSARAAIALVDVMEDHTDLALGMVHQLAGEVLDHVSDHVPDPELVN